MDEDIKLPEPFGYVSDCKHAGIRIMSFQHAPYDQTHSLYHSTREVYTAEQLRAAVEADRAKRVPGGYSQDQIEQAAMEAEIPDAKLESLLIALASTPAPEQPARKPLTDEQILDGLSTIGVTVWGQRSEDFEAGARFAERMHGIGEKMP